MTDRKKYYAGMAIFKDRDGDARQRDTGLEAMSADLSDAVDLLKKSQKEYKDTVRTMKALQDKVDKHGKLDSETQELLKKQADTLTEAMSLAQGAQEAVDILQKQMSSPIYAGGSDLVEKDIENAIELQRRAFLAKGMRDPQDFRPDMDNLVNPADYRSAVRKWLTVGIESREAVRNSFTPEERKAFDAASLDSGFFSPELLGIEVDCEVECASMLDLYDSVNVSRSNFMFPHVESYGDIGSFHGGGTCDSEMGPEGNISWKHGQTYDFRAAYCFNQDTLREANYDLMGFMIRSLDRSFRINRNRVMITGDGINEPTGWLTADKFAKVSAPTPNPDHRALRQFLASSPVEYGPVQAVMHQNTFAYFASMVDSTGRFLFGDGMMGFGPDEVMDRIRISNCLPDPTAGGTRGSAVSPFVTDDFVMAAGVWERAYTTVSHRPLFLEQYIGGSTAWCVSYQGGAKLGGFVSCAPAARTLRAG